MGLQVFYGIAQPPLGRREGRAAAAEPTREGRGRLPPSARRAAGSGFAPLWRAHDAQGQPERVRLSVRYKTQSLCSCLCVCASGGRRCRLKLGEMASAVAMPMVCERDVEPLWAATAGALSREAQLAPFMRQSSASSELSVGGRATFCASERHARGVPVHRPITRMQPPNSARSSRFAALRATNCSGLTRPPAATDSAPWRGCSPFPLNLFAALSHLLIRPLACPESSQAPCEPRQPDPLLAD